MSKHTFWGGVPRRALILLVTISMVLGMCPAAGIAEEVLSAGKDVGGEVMVVEDSTEGEAAVVEEKDEGAEEALKAEELTDDGDDEPALVTQALPAVPYMAWEEAEKAVRSVEGGCTDYAVVTSSTTALENGKWYVVSDDVGIGSRVTVTGTANLILCDGKTLTAGAGITVSDGNTLNIYAQSEGTGALTAGSFSNANAPIGGEDAEGKRNCGAAIIHGGKITATGYSDYYGNGAAGIGGSGNGGTGGNVTVYAGEVTARGGYGFMSNRGGAGIGGGNGGDGGTVTVYGGTVTATGLYSAGIGGGGDGRSGGTFTIYGGTVNANGGGYSAGIGGGSGGAGGTVTVNGGTVTASAAYSVGIGATRESVDGAVTINGGTVTATSSYYGAGIGGTVTVNGGTITATGGEYGALADGYYGTGFGGTLIVGTACVAYSSDAEITDDNKSDAASERGTGSASTIERKRYMLVEGVIHVHDFSYAADGTTITADCVAADCALDGHKATLTIAAPTLATYGQTSKSADATLVGTDAFNDATGKDVSADDIKYFKATKSGNAYERDGKLASAPTAAGDYVAEIRVGHVRTSAGDDQTVTASVGYTIAPREAELSWEGTSFAYDGASHAPTATVSNLVAGEECAVTVSGATTNAGTHTATATQLSNANYKLPAKATQSFTIAPAKLTTIAKVSAKTYTGKAIKPTPAVKAGSATLQAGNDFTYSYRDNVNAGTATVTATGKGNYVGIVSTTFKIAKAAPEPTPTPTPAKTKLTSIAKVSAKTYTGKAIKPTPAVKAGSATLKAGADFTYSYKANVNVGTATVTATGKGSYTGTVKTTFKINQAKLTSIAKVADKAYTGKVITPKPAVKSDSKTLKAGTDFTYSYKNNAKAGTATVTATGKGGYDGSVKTTFKIVAPTASARACVAGSGWQAAAAGGSVAGTTGQERALEAFRLSLGKGFPVPGGIAYRAHAQGSGWQTSWARDGATCGKANNGRRLEAVQVKLTGQMAKRYDVYYRVHVKTLGWMGWAKNGQSAGTAGQSRRAEAIQVVIVPKGAKAPSTNYNGVKQTFSKAFIQG